ncbi:MAG TPA: DUF4381 family protein [Steroidobacteraceae bacterium]
MRRRVSGIRAAAAVGALGGLLGAGLWAAPAADPEVPAASSAKAAAPGSEEDIRDIRGPQFVLPAVLLPALIAGAALIALGFYVFWRVRRNRRARILLPYEIALQQLEDIRTLMLPASVRQFSTAVSDIVRHYIELRFAITVTPRTTEEFLRDLLAAADASLARHQPLLAEFLQQCDFVKFAAMSLTLHNMESLRQSARDFVMATVKPEDDPIPTT